MESFMPLLFIVALVIGGIIMILPAFIAYKKGHKSGWWCVYSVLFWPIAFIHSMFVSPIGAAIDRDMIAAGKKKCYYCAEFIQPEARICRYCGKDVD